MNYVNFDDIDLTLSDAFSRIYKYIDLTLSGTISVEYINILT